MANLIPDELINQIRETNDIVEVITEYIPLKKRGKNYVALCPFHPEKKPSFSVNQEKQIYYCFGCGKGGNVYTFLMEYEKLSFYESLKLLAKRANVSIPQKSRDRKTAETLDKLFYANEVANEYFQLSLERNKQARVYLHNRGFSSETIKIFSMGYATPDWEGLIRFSRKKGLDIETLLSAGLVIRREKKEGYYDRFRDRITFPIYNLSQKVVGFGGRILSEEAEPKYLNSPDSPIYNKGKILYGLNLSKGIIREKKAGVLVEGYIDLISLYQAGIKNIIASLGTSFTRDHARLLSRYAEKVYLLFDSDRAGESAVLRSVDLLFDSGVEVMIVVFPPGEDPDSYLRKFGIKDLVMEFKKAKSFIEYKKDNLPEEFNSLSIKEQERIIKELAETASHIKNQLWKDLFINKVAQTFKINENIIRNATSGLGLRERDQKLESKEGLKGLYKLERELLKILIEDYSLMNGVKSRLTREDFLNAEDGELYNTILDLFEKEGKISPAALIDKTKDQKIKELITEIATLDLGIAKPQTMIEDYLKKLKQSKKSNQIRKLKGEIELAWNKGEKDKAKVLTVKLHSLIKDSF